MSVGLVCVCWPGVCACGQAVLHTCIGVGECPLAWYVYVGLVCVRVGRLCYTHV